jgi:hypothetical protein
MPHCCPARTIRVEPDVVQNECEVSSQPVCWCREAPAFPLLGDHFSPIPAWPLSTVEEQERVAALPGLNYRVCA